MKKVKYLAMLLAAGMFAACSDNLEDTGAGNAGGTTPATGEGYVKVAINMPTTSGMSRVGEDGTSVDLEDGLTPEYEVKDGILVFFKTTDNTDGAKKAESTATFVKAYDIKAFENGTAGNNQVTTRRSVISEAPMAGDGEQIYVLAILNTNDLFNQNNGNLLDASGNNIFATDKTIKALQTAITTSAKAVTTEGFTMLNAPLAKSSTAITSVNDNVQTLVPVTVYETEEDADQGEISSIYVERVVAKVTLTGFTLETKENDFKNKYTMNVATDDNNSPFYGDKVTLEGWTLSVTNKTTKAVRDISGNTNIVGIVDWVGTTYSSTGNNRFLGTSEIDNKDLYRIYWGIDNNYASSDYTESNPLTSCFNVLPKTGIWTNENEGKWESAAETTTESHPLYCLENTMNYNQQNHNQTTTLVIKTKYYANPTSTEDGAQSFFMYGANNQTYTVDGFIKEVEKALGWTEESSPKKTISLATPVPDGGDYVFDKTTIPDGKLNIKDLFVVKTEGTEESSELSDEEATKIYSALGEIRFYKDGTVYYNNVRIRHFVDDYTDVVWSPSTPDYTEKHLGRYGVLRNNWYEVNVTGISGPGDTQPEDPGDNNNDEDEGYIRAEINVLSWAKRSQNVEL